MGNFKVDHRFPISAEAYWDTLFFDEPFNKKFYLEELGFDRYEISDEVTEADGSRSRTIKSQPKSDMPAAVKKIIGDELVYLERGRFDAKTKRYRFDIEVPKFKDKVRIKGDFWVEPDGADACRRLCEMSVQVKMFGVGGLVEGFIERQTSESYDKAAEYTLRTLAQR